jgi:ribulose-5-phosphate 4-epimerase/fuculose-1-phosphate aldolase
MIEAQLRVKLVEMARSLFDRGYTMGGSGNISLRLPDGYLMTPTGSCLGRLEPGKLSKLDMQGDLLSGEKPSKEWLVHLQIYQSRPQCGAVVHLHSPYAVAVSCLKGLDPKQPLPPLTPYYVMRVKKLALLPYHMPGAESLAQNVARSAKDHSCLLLAHHGSFVAGRDLEDAVNASEELEQTARLFMLLNGRDHACLDSSQVAELEQRFNG